MKDLFGEEIKSDYQKFTEKFEPKLTTDDCYTPIEVYNWILGYVKEQCNISDTTRVIRPFYPGGDYINEDYSGDCVVIDNPPFSILAKICRYYNAHGVRYFLFAPHLTLFGSVVEATRIVAYCEITYHNGAKVKTSFISNLFGDLGVIADSTYRREVKKIQDLNKPKLPRYVYPDNVITVSRLAAIIVRGGAFKLHKNEVHKIMGLESQKPHKKAIFGGGYLISDERAEELRAEELRAEELRAEELRAKELKSAIKWPLSDKEKDIISQLGGGSKQ